MISRRTFIQITAILFGRSVTGFSRSAQHTGNQIMTVTGPVTPDQLGTTLIHEHILVDFIGAAQYDPLRWNDDEVIKKVLPYLKEVKDAGCRTLIDCTPNFLGRDVQLLQKLSKESDMLIITNTGYYGGSDEKFLPPEAFTETSAQLADRWVAEWERGIDATDVRPGFMKISVNPGILSPVSRKLVEAAAKAHLRSGLTIASHTGPAVPAFEELEILRREGVSPNAFIWVHAQSEKDFDQYVKAAQAGCWVSLDGVNESNISHYVEMLSELKKEKSIHKILISHDAGWYEPGKPAGGNFRGYTTIFKQLLPALKAKGFTNVDIQQLLVENPRDAFTIRVRKMEG